MICDSCKKPLNIRETLVVWDYEENGSIKRLQALHKNKCDNRELPCSGGAAYGKEWFKDDFVVGGLKKLKCSGLAERRLNEILANIDAGGAELLPPNLKYKKVKA